MLTVVSVLFFITAAAYAGSPCPDRQNIYPCSCQEIPMQKKLSYTTVTCHRLQSTDSMNAIFPTLKTMTIDRFYLYDSFWEAEQDKQVLPANWITLLKVKEIEIVDTALSSCFPCESTMVCRNAVTNRFTAINSSSHDSICTICEPKVGATKFSWTGCMQKLRQFHFQYGKLKTVNGELFKLPMTELMEIDLSHNQISKVEANAFANTKRLKILILSYNVLENLNAMFSEQLPNLERLDVSWNLLKSLGSSSVFLKAPMLKTLEAHNNFFASLKESEWKGVGKDFRVLNLLDNNLHCDCDIRWINSTFAIHVAIQGICSTPERYENSNLRTASRNLNEVCDEDGNIGTRPPKTTAS